MKLNFHFSQHSLLKSVATPHPSRDWYIVLSIILALGVALMGVSLYFYTGLHSGFLLAPSLGEETTVPAVSREVLNDIVSRFDVVEVNYQSQNVHTPDVADPR